MNEKDRADVLRQRWRAQVHELDGDADGKALCLHVADVMEAYHKAKDAALPLKQAMKINSAVERLKSLGVDVPQELLDAVEDAGGSMTEAEYYGSVAYLNYQMAFGQVVQTRRYWRGIAQAGGWFAAQTLDNFSEPSDEDLLAGDDGEAA